MKVLLINPHTYFHNYENRRVADTIPIGIGIVNETFSQNDCSTIILDIQGRNLTLEEVNNILLEYKNENIDLIAISAMSVQYAYVKWLSKKCKEIFGDVIQILGGCLAHYNYNICFKHTNLDLLILGEAENTLPLLIKSSFKDLTDVPSIAYKNTAQFIDNDRKKKIEYYEDIEITKHDIVEIDLNNPKYHIIPSYRKLDLHLYTNQLQNVIMGNLISARGCPYNCHFCSRQFKNFRLYPIDFIEKQILSLKKNLPNVKYIVFIDEFVLFNLKRAMVISDIMKKYNFRWSCNGRTNNFTREIANYIKKSGCETVTFGLESGSNKILKAMNKKQTFNIERQAIKIALEAGLKVNPQLIIGYPGEDKNTLKETRKLFKGFDTRISRAGFGIITPLPGSVLYNECIQNGQIIDEEAYLYSLEGGFRTIHINLTNWTDQTLYYYKELYTIILNKELGYNYKFIPVGIIKFVIKLKTSIEKRFNSKYLGILKSLFNTISRGIIWLLRKSI